MRVDFSLAERGRLTFAHDAPTQGQDVDIGGQEAAIGVGGRVDDRLATDVEAGVDQDRTARPPLEGMKQRVEDGEPFGIHGLDSGRVVDVSHGGDHAARDFQLVDAFERLPGLPVARQPFLRTDVRDEEHVGAVFARPHLEVFVDVFAQNRWCEGPERLAKLDLEIHDRLHRRASRITEDAGAPAEAAREAKFHAPFEPPNNILRGEVLSAIASAKFLVGVASGETSRPPT